jgi:soluble lytic murein transglycosylase-like protein
MFFGIRAVILAGFLAVFFFPLGSGGSLAWSDIYGYQDEKGVVHYSNVPTDRRFRFVMKERKVKKPKALYENDRNGYDDLIRKICKEKGVDPHLVKAVVKVESNYDHRAVSKKGARGLMQIMPETGKQLGLVDPFHPEKNLAAGVHYLKGLLDKYRGKLSLALAAYNAGETAVDRYQGIPPYPETRGYVRKVLRLYRESKSNR